jgi:hypothetical protein
MFFNIATGTSFTVGNDVVDKKLVNAEFVGANTVNFPLPSNTVFSPVLSSAVLRVEKFGFEAAMS